MINAVDPKVSFKHEPARKPQCIASQVITSSCIYFRLVLTAGAGSNASSSSSISSLRTLAPRVVRPALVPVPVGATLPRELVCDGTKLSVDCVCFGFAVEAARAGCLDRDVEAPRVAEDGAGDGAVRPDRRLLVEDDAAVRLAAVDRGCLTKRACESSSSETTSASSSSLSLSSTMTTSSSSSSSSSSTSASLRRLLEDAVAAAFVDAAPLREVVDVIVVLPPRPLPRPRPAVAGRAPSSSSSSAFGSRSSLSEWIRAPGWSSHTPSRSVSQPSGLGLNRFFPLVRLPIPLANISSISLRYLSMAARSELWASSSSSRSSRSRDIKCLI